MAWGLYRLYGMGKLTSEKYLLKCETFLTPESCCGGLRLVQEAAAAELSCVVEELVRRASRAYEGPCTTALHKRGMICCIIAASLNQFKACGTPEARIINALSDYAFLFPAVRPIISEYLERETSLESLFTVTPHEEVDEVARSVALLRSSRCLAYQQHAILLALHKQPSVRWLALSHLTDDLGLSAPSVHALEQRMLTDSNISAFEGALERRQRGLEVRVQGLKARKVGQAATD
jgi:hypothetical protein